MTFHSPHSLSDSSPSFAFLSLFPFPTAWWPHFNYPSLPSGFPSSSSSSSRAPVPQSLPRTSPIFRPGFRGNEKELETVPPSLPTAFQTKSPAPHSPSSSHPPRGPLLLSFRWRESRHRRRPAEDPHRPFRGRAAGGPDPLPAEEERARSPGNEPRARPLAGPSRVPPRGLPPPLPRFSASRSPNPG